MVQRNIYVWASSRPPARSSRRLGKTGKTGKTHCFPVFLFFLFSLFSPFFLFFHLLKHDRSFLAHYASFIVTTWWKAHTTNIFLRCACLFGQVRDFVDREIMPNISEWEDSYQMSPDIYEKAGKAGLFAGVPCTSLIMDGVCQSSLLSELGRILDIVDTFFGNQLFSMLNEFGHTKLVR